MAERQRLLDEAQPIVERDAQHASEEGGRSLAVGRQLLHIGIQLL
ncbi:MAG: hypothetical protein U0X20_13710 [Caldilineaceae bacterium]